MSFDPIRREILILADEPPIRHLQNLVKRLEIENPADGSEGLANVIMDRAQYDSVILDLRCSNPRPGNEIHGIGKIHTSRVGRTLSVRAQVNGPKTLSVVERYLADGLPGPLLWLVSHRYRSR